MGKIFLVLFAGFLLGYFGIVKGYGMRINGKLQTLWLLLLIFCMGVSVGENQEVIGNLTTLGVRAFLYAVATIVGSVLVVFFISKTFLKKEGE